MTYRVTLYDETLFFIVLSLWSLCWSVQIEIDTSSFIKEKVEKVNLYSTLLCLVSKVLKYGPCVTMGSHSFACYPHTNHTCFYSPATRCYHPLAGTLCLPTKGLQGWVDLNVWLHTEINVRHWELNPDMVTHPSANRARRRLTSLIEINTLPLCQTTTDHLLLNVPRSLFVLCVFLKLT